MPFRIGFDNMANMLIGGSGGNSAPINGLIAEWASRGPLIYEKKIYEHTGNRGGEVKVGRCYKLDGLSQKVSYGDVGTIAKIGIYLKFETENQEILTVADSTATAAKVVGGVLTFGGSLSVTAIEVDGESKTAAEAGALLNEKKWHHLSLTVSYTASALIIGTDSSAFGNFGFYGLYLSDVLIAKCDEQSGTVSFRCDGSSEHGTIVNGATTVHVADTGVGVENIQNQYDGDWLNQYGFNPSGDVFIPRDESDPTRDATGTLLSKVGKVKYALNLIESNCFSVDGSSIYANFGDEICNYTTEDFSIFCRFRTASSSTRMTLIFQGTFNNTSSGAAGSGYSLMLYDGQLWFSCKDGTNFFYKLASPTNFADGEEHSVLATYFGGGQITIFADGVEIAAATSGTTIGSLSSTGDLLLGYGAGAFFDGELFDFRQWSEIKTWAEVMSEDTEGLDIWVPFSEGAGEKVNDVSGNDHHGNIVNHTIDVWDEEQDEFHYNIKYGFVIYEKASEDDIFVPYCPDGTKPSITIPSGYTEKSDHPPGRWFSPCETKIVAPQAPQLILAEQLLEGIGKFFFDIADNDYDQEKIEVGDIEANFGSKNQLFARLRTGKVDRWILYESILEGSELTQAQEFTGQ